jgi:hypothetical protein
MKRTTIKHISNIPHYSEAIKAFREYVTKCGYLASESANERNVTFVLHYDNSADYTYIDVAYNMAMCGEL